MFSSALLMFSSVPRMASLHLCLLKFYLFFTAEPMVFNLPQKPRVLRKPFRGSTNILFKLQIFKNIKNYVKKMHKLTS